MGRCWQIVVSIVVGSSLLAACFPSVLAADAPTQQALSAKLAEICRKHDVPAMSVAVVDGKGLVASQCFGVRKRGTSDQVELSDRFPLGSCTKSMTATVSAVLVDSGKINWETTIGEVWPKATDEFIHPKLRDVTLEELLSHQSGLPGDISEISSQAWAKFFEESQSPVLERRRMLTLFLSKPPTQARGTFVYSNLGYAVASAMLETRAQEPFETLMAKHVFEPLEMPSADFRTLKLAEQLKPPLLWGHRAEGGAPMDPRLAGAENPSVYAAAGTVHMSIEDYAKYARWHLVGSPSPVLRSQGAFDQLHQPIVDYTLPGCKYGCGWICSDTALGPALTHAGSNTNAFAVIWVLPESNFAAVVCTNSGEPQAFPACDELMAYLMKELATKRAGGQEVTPDRLVGRYQLTPNFIFDVSVKDGHVMVGITNQPTQEVFPDSPTKWSYRGVDAQLEFSLRATGPAYAVTLHQNGASQKAVRMRN
ncbi:serine hydrolase [Aureliella helgolandensis]|uniref:D-alanyl-D-alanine carboxypeptidase n=1 Tax=Aureliella helgolandensis TaxID=2527968 RepID=A0A518G8V3_9BACT|nr:serine hydrolase [Aureliella helgolandensis]QDV25003.1 D-alanyl-D-alanine carboxypeptidase precursor [Aureliella helgolandensis]